MSNILNNTPSWVFKISSFLRTTLTRERIENKVNTLIKVYIYILFSFTYRKKKSTAIILFIYKAVWFGKETSTHCQKHTSLGQVKRLPDGKILHFLPTPSLMGYGSDSIKLFQLGNSCFTIMFTYDTVYHQVQVGLHYNHKKPITFWGL